MIKTVFLDIDGVLASFRKGVCNALNKSYDYTTMSSKWKFWEDWPDITFEMVNNVCTFDFWQYLPWMHDGRDILQAIMDTIGLEKVYLLSTPMPNIESPTGKWLWVSDNLPIYLKRTIIIPAPKFLLAQPNTLLIDDKDENVEEFRAKKGNAILVPRPYNKKYKYSDISSQIVRQELENIT